MEKSAKEMEKVLNSLHRLERKVLPVLRQDMAFEDIVSETGLKEVEVMRALQWLANKNIITIKEDVEEIVKLDKNGEKYTKEGFPEILFLKAIKGETSVNEIRKKTKLNNEELNISLGLLRRKAAIFIKKDKELKVKIMDQGKRLLDSGLIEERFVKKLPLKVVELKDEDKYAYEELKKRKEIIKTVVVKYRKIKITSLGEEMIKRKFEDEGVIDRLTPEMMKKKTWKDKKFRAYDIKANVPNVFGGKVHFVNQAVDYIKKIWLDMGFKEMRGNIVQTAFWDLDALFVPQDHPARAMQDTFYIKDPSKGELPKEFVSKVKDVHENGANTGSKGWKYIWNPEVAKENLLRTHTTPLSARTISQLKEKDLPAKFFCVGKVFRNETVDWKHLFELTQVEGIVVDENVTLGDLKGYLREFFTKMGYKEVRIVPSHFPYTEPSAEIHALHPIRNEWVELGGAGILRPEVTKTLMGFECPILAWGLGMERIISDYYEINDIRELYKNDLKQIKEMKMWMK